MKKMFYFFTSLLVVLLSCSDEEKTPTFIAPSNLVVTTDISDDGSGKVDFTATADNASSFNFAFGDGTSQESFTGKVSKVYEMSGDNTYDVTVKASGAGGTSISETIQIQVSVDEPPSENAVQKPGSWQRPNPVIWE